MESIELCIDKLSVLSPSLSLYLETYSMNYVIFMSRLWIFTYLCEI